MSKHTKSPTGTPAMNRDDVPERGWGPSVDDTSTQVNPSAHRSFHPDQYAPKPGPRPPVATEESGNPAGNPVRSHGRRGEDIAKKPQKGHHDTGPRGPSQRPSGTRDQSAVTGIDPQDPPNSGA
ncbi:hypothetical protein [Streptacidiphilus neutrinimicus]|uniref:hypothetical protein n=1 Tax=Streptacidiphilus neutrinimicus TaxID=105420 RepID=UPI0005AACCE5|nr:hypothetical protein [Streptacidiphilus neutrinimicus]